MTKPMRCIFVVVGVGIVVLSILRARDAVYWAAPIGLVLIAMGATMKDV